MPDISAIWNAGGSPAAVPLAVAAALLAIMLLYLLFRRRLTESREEFRNQIEESRLGEAILATRLDERDEALAEAGRRIGRLECELEIANQAKSALAAEKAVLEQARREQAEIIERSETRLREAFGSLSREALGRNSEMFLALAKSQLGEYNREARAELEARRTAVDALVKPIGETLSRMGTALETAEKTRSNEHASLVAIQKNLSEATGRLARALHHTGARGRWGELQLRRVVEMAGMLEHCDFEEQVTVTDREGRQLRPDLVVRLVGGRSVVVDAKTPMDSYLAGREAETEERRTELGRKHAKAVRDHMVSLGAKAYWSQFDDSPEFVVMFFPNEAVFAEAIRADPELLEFGILNRVIAASPATLAALLKIVAYGWQQQRAHENAKTIFAMGRQLHKRFTLEYDYLSALGAALSKAVESFNKCVGSAERNLFPALRRFSELTELEMFQEPAEIDSRPREIAADNASEAEDGVAGDPPTGE